jgi:hypothetical protein
MHETLPKLVETMKEKFITQPFQSCDTCIVNFDKLWMLKGGINTFVLIIHF